MSKVSYHKIGNEDKLKLLNEMLVEFELKKQDLRENDFIRLNSVEQAEFLASLGEDMNSITLLNEEINKLISYAPDLSKKIYLSEVIDIEKPVFGSNNLIVSPVGSGKTTLITEKLIEDKKQTVLLLVSNDALKDSLAPEESSSREKLKNRMFTSANRETFGDKKYRIHVMTYAEFGEKIYVNDDFLNKSSIDLIFCDEIHSLPEYIKYGAKSNGGLIHAQRFLFSNHENITIFYFTATDSNLLQAERERVGTLKEINIFNYSEYPNIMKYMPKAIREINNIEQIRQYLKDRRVSFDFYSYKGIAFSKTISSLKRIEEIVIEEGYNPLVLWSNKNDNYELSDEQLEARSELLNTNQIPEPYDFLIYNSALQEGWDLKDKSVKIAIMNTTNETDYIQALGRLRRDVDLLVYRTKNKKIELNTIDLAIPDEFLVRPLDKTRKDELIARLGFLNNKGNLVSWRIIKEMVDESSNYELKESTKQINGKRTRVSIITESSKC